MYMLHIIQQVHTVELDVITVLIGSAHLNRKKDQHTVVLDVSTHADYYIPVRSKVFGLSGVMQTYLLLSTVVTVFRNKKQHATSGSEKLNQSESVVIISKKESDCIKVYEKRTILPT